MNTRRALAAACVASILAVSSGLAAAAPSPTFLLPPKASASPNTAMRRAGGHYSIAIADQIRQCSGLAAAYDQAVSGRGGAQVSPAAQALHDQGAALCAGGARMEGVAKLTTALRDIGVAPRVY